MSIELDILIKHKLLKPHPFVAKLKELYTYIIEYEDDVIYLNYDYVLKGIKKFSKMACLTCSKWDVNNEVCSKCDKCFCYQCGQIDFEQVCKNCIEKCYLCNESYKQFNTCHECDRKFCNDNEDCVSGIICTVNGCRYMFCNNNCISINFKRTQVIISLKRFFRRKNLRDAFRMYRIKMRSDSTLCDNYIKGALDSTWTPEKVAQKMCEMKFLYDHCELEYWLRTLSYQEVDEWSRENPEVKPVVSPKFELAKIKALENHKLKSFPVVWPWKTKIFTDHKKKLSTVLLELSFVPPKKGFLGGEEYHCVKNHFFSNRFL